MGMNLPVAPFYDAILSGVAQPESEAPSLDGYTAIHSTNESALSLRILRFDKPRLMVLSESKASGAVDGCSPVSREAFGALTNTPSLCFPQPSARRIHIYDKMSQTICCPS